MACVVGDGLVKGLIDCLSLVTIVECLKGSNLPRVSGCV